MRKENERKRNFKKIKYILLRLKKKVTLQRENKHLQDESLRLVCGCEGPLFYLH